MSGLELACYGPARCCSSNISMKPVDIRKLYICGAGGMGREVLELARTVNVIEQRWDWIGLVEKAGVGSVGCEVAGTDELLMQASVTTDVAVGIADPEVKSALVARLMKNPHLHFPSLVHPQAYISPGARIGVGVIVQWGCWVSTNVELDDFSFVNVACHIGHDVSIGRYTSLMVNVDLGGHVQVGEGCYFGTKSTVVPSVRIGRGVRVGAASLVAYDVVDGLTVIGNPARYIDPRT